MKGRSRAALIARVVLLLPVLVLVPLSKAQVARIAKGALLLPKNHFSLPSQGDPRPAEPKPDKALSVEAQDAETPVYEIQKVFPAVFRGDVRNLPLAPQQERQRPELERPSNLKLLSPIGHQPEEPNISLAPMPGPIQNFPGLSRTDICTGGQCGAGIPPDTNGDVGPNHYIQAVNSAYAIYDKSTGNLLASFTENSLFSGGPTGTVCDTSSFGDPIVVYDALADRWILSNFAFDVVGDNPVSPFFQCIAVSQTSNPVTGGWFLYAIRTDTGSAGQPPVNTVNDYPKFGIWADCLYYSANGFLMPAGTYNGGEFGSFSRSDMYAGLPLTGALGFAASTNDFFTMIPSNLSAPGAAGLPPAGRPNFYVQESLTAFNYRVRAFTAGTNCGSGGILGAATTVSQTSYTGGGGNNVPQPPPATSSNTLDSLFDRMMQKVQYRKVGSAESLWVVHTVQNSGATDRPQWAQIDVTGGTIATTPVQQQIYGPDATLYRWMGSIAADKDGNVALGYSTSNATSPNFPSIGYSGRLAGDPLNTLPQTETQLIGGNGSQVNNCGTQIPCHRWGDYSAMSVDPVDGCTFWYTNEYYVNQANGNAGAWNTRIGSFKFDSCTPFGTTPTNTPTPTPTNTPTPTPITPGSDFYTVAPCRQYDSRNSTPLPDNTNRSVTLTGAPCGVPATAVAVSANITVFGITGAGGNAVFQVGTANNPTFAWINYPPSETQRGNAGFLPLNGSGQIVVKVNQGGGSINFLVDVNGYFQ